MSIKKKTEYPDVSFTADILYGLTYFYNYIFDVMTRIIIGDASDLDFGICPVC